jgi:amino acid permease
MLLDGILPADALMQKEALRHHAAGDPPAAIFRGAKNEPLDRREYEAHSRGSTPTTSHHLQQEEGRLHQVLGGVLLSGRGSNNGKGNSSNDEDDPRDQPQACYVALDEARPSHHHEASHHDAHHHGAATMLNGRLCSGNMERHGGELVDLEYSKIIEHEQEDDDGDDDNATFAQCVFNMSNILMGVGMLGLPYVLKAVGWIGGCVVCVGFGSVMWYTSLLIGRTLNGDARPTSFFDDSPYKTALVPGSSEAARMRPSIKSFPQIARESFGYRGDLVLSTVLYFELFSCLCIFLVSLGDHLERLFPSLTKNTHMVLMSVVLIIPTAVLRTPRLLSYLSMVGTFATVCVVAAVLLSALAEGDISSRISEETGEPETPRVLWSSSGLPLALGLIAYTFSGHAIVPSIYTSMDRPQDFEYMIHCTFLIVMGCCLVVAISGYYMFGNAVQDQITLSLEESSSSEAAMECLSTLLSVLPSCAFRCFGSCVRCDAYSANTFSFSQPGS